MVAAVAAAIGVGSAVALAALAAGGKQLSLLDGLAALAVVSAVAGQLWLAIIAVRSGRRWPMRPGSSSEVLRFLGWLSILTGVIAASRFLVAVPTPRVVRGVQVNGVLEFVVAATLFALPGAILLILRLVSFKSTGPSTNASKPPASSTTSTLATQATFDVEFVGTYRRDQLTQMFSDAPRPSTPALDALIARTWEASRSLAQADDTLLFNGRLIRLMRASADRNTLHLELGSTDYRDFCGTNIHNAHSIALDQPESLANPLGISAIPVTSDGWIVLGRRGEGVAFHAGHLHTIGGIVEQADRRADGEVDVFGAVLRELAEELCVRSEEIERLAIEALVRDREILQPELLFEVGLSVSREDLCGRFDRQATGQEHSAIEFILDEPEAILPFLGRASPVAPVAEAALLLHGRLQWGTDWYEQSCYVLFGEVPRQPTRANRG
jgi:hypothetical protein